MRFVCHLDEEIRCIEAEYSELCFESLSTCIALRFDIPREILCIFFVDEEHDHVALSCDEDLEDAIEMNKDKRKVSLFLKLREDPMETMKDSGFNIVRLPLSDIRHSRVNVDAIRSSECSDEEKTISLSESCFLVDEKEAILNELSALPTKELEGLQKMMHSIHISENQTHPKTKCTQCNQSPIRGIRYVCTMCPEVSLCFICENSSVHPSNHPLIKLKTPCDDIASIMESGNRIRTHDSRRQLQCKYFVKYLKDVSIPDRSEVAPGIELNKFWELVNVGDHDWPSGFSIEQISGDRIFKPESFTILPTVPSKASFRVSAVIKAPTRPGRYTSYVKLIDDKGTRFGPRFWVDFMVSGILGEVKPIMASEVRRASLCQDVNSGLVVAAPAVDFAEGIERFKKQLSELSSIGFRDTALNIYMLEKYRGNLQRVANWYIDQNRTFS